MQSFNDHVRAMFSMYKFRQLFASKNNTDNDKTTTESKIVVLVARWNNSIECPICKLDEKCIEALLCGHVFCKRCLDVWARKSNGHTYIKCPVCNGYSHLRTRLFV